MTTRDNHSSSSDLTTGAALHAQIATLQQELTAARVALPPPLEPQELKRYDLVVNYRAGSSIEEMERSDDGEWVRYEDVVQQLDATAAALTSLQLDACCVACAEGNHQQCLGGRCALYS